MEYIHTNRPIDKMFKKLQNEGLLHIIYKYVAQRDLIVAKIRALIDEYEQLDHYSFFNLMLQNIDKHVKKEAIKKPYGSLLDEMMLTAEENRRTFMTSNEQYFISSAKKTIYSTPKI
jgi:tRNA isopentenyl-2-thiomethyl-A-37 hydroxylase MiaE